MRFVDTFNEQWENLTILCHQVDAFLEAHDSGLTDADKEVANGQFLDISPL